MTRMTLASYFAASGYRVRKAEDVTEMRKCLSKMQIDLILLYITLPGEDGFSLLRQKAQTRNRRDYVTGKTDAVDRILGLELGAHDDVTKPFNNRELLARAKNP